MATVPMLAPDGTSGDIPQEKMQDAIASGFKVAVPMTSPDGKPGYIPADRQQDAMKAGFKIPGAGSISPMTERQRFLTTYPVGANGEGLGENLHNMAQNAGVGVFQAANALVHPLDTAKALLDSLNPRSATPNPLQQAYQGLNTRPGEVGSQMGGQALAGAAAGAAVEPVANLISKGVGRAALLGNTPEGAYESALKPSTTIPAATRANIIQTGLDQAIPVSKAGLEKIGDLIDDYNQKIKAQIDSDPNRPIDPNAVATRADLAKAKFANQVNAQGDLDAIDASRQQFLNEQGAPPGNQAPPMGAADAQAMKQGTYRVLSGKYGEQGSAAVEAQKALARGLKEEIATQFPEISKLNSAESQLLDLQPILERAVARTSNHQLIGIGTPIAGSAVKAVTGSGGAGAVAAALKAVLDNPAVKSRLAIAVSKGGKIPYAQAAARVGAYSSALGSAQTSDPAATQ